MRTNRVILGMCLLSAAGVAYFSGVRQARADYCWVRTTQELHENCSPCIAYACPDCFQGTCPGNKKYCNLAQNWEPREEDGYANLGIHNKPCFTLYDCKPASGSNCGGKTEIECVTDLVNPQHSSTTFPQEWGGTECETEPE